MAESISPESPIRQEKIVQGASADYVSGESRDVLGSSPVPYAFADTPPALSPRSIPVMGEAPMHPEEKVAGGISDADNAKFDRLTGDSASSSNFGESATPNTSTSGGGGEVRFSSVSSVAEVPVGQAAAPVEQMVQPGAQAPEAEKSPGSIAEIVGNMKEVNADQRLQVDELKAAMQPESKAQGPLARLGAKMDDKLSSFFSEKNFPTYFAAKRLWEKGKQVQENIGSALKTAREIMDDAKAVSGSIKIGDRVLTFDFSKPEDKAAAAKPEQAASPEQAVPAFDAAKLQEELLARRPEAAQKSPEAVQSVSSENIDVSPEAMEKAQKAMEDPATLSFLDSADEFAAKHGIEGKFMEIALASVHGPEVAKAIMELYKNPAEQQFMDDLNEGPLKDMSPEAKASAIAEMREKQKKEGAKPATERAAVTPEARRQARAERREQRVAVESHMDTTMEPAEQIRAINRERGRISQFSDSSFGDGSSSYNFDPGTKIDFKYANSTGTKGELRAAVAEHNRQLTIARELNEAQGSDFEDKFEAFKRGLDEAGVTDVKVETKSLNGEPMKAWIPGQTSMRIDKVGGQTVISFTEVAKNEDGTPIKKKMDSSLKFEEN